MDSIKFMFEYKYRAENLVKSKYALTIVKLSEQL